MHLVLPLGAGKIHITLPTLPFFPINKLPEFSSSQIHIFSSDPCPTPKIHFSRFLVHISTWIFQVEFNLNLPNMEFIAFSPKLALSHTPVFIFFANDIIFYSVDLTRNLGVNPGFSLPPYPPYCYLSPKFVSSTTLICFESNHFCPFPLLLP